VIELVGTLITLAHFALAYLLILGVGRVGARPHADTLPGTSDEPELRIAS
jgi:hypothetical protein